MTAGTTNDEPGRHRVLDVVHSFFKVITRGFGEAKSLSYIYNVNKDKLKPKRVMSQRFKEIKRLNIKEHYESFLANECIVENPKEVIFHTVASMCDNEHMFRFKKDASGEFKLNCNGFAYSNFGISDHKYQLEWAADKGDFFNVIQMINSGFQVVEEVRSR